MLQISYLFLFFLFQPILLSSDTLDLIPITSEQIYGEADHKSWDRLLHSFVDEKGNVDYRGFKKESETLNRYLEQLGSTTVSENWSREKKLAYYINIYNAATVKLILDNYPLASIRDINKPWDRAWIEYGGEFISLGEIEHQILRKMNEPRIHFAINCASYSCPKLLNEAYTEGKLEKQLKYTTEIEKKGKKILWCVKEHPTDNIIAKFFFEEDAQRVAELQNKHKVWLINGGIPDFLCYKGEKRA